MQYDNPSLFNSPMMQRVKLYGGAVGEFYLSMLRVRPYRGEVRDQS